MPRRLGELRHRHTRDTGRTEMKQSSSRRVGTIAVTVLALATACTSSSGLDEGADRPLVPNETTQSATSDSDAVDGSSDEVAVDSVDDSGGDDEAGSVTEPDPSEPGTTEEPGVLLDPGQPEPLESATGSDSSGSGGSGGDSAGGSGGGSAGGSGGGSAGGSGGSPAPAPVDPSGATADEPGAPSACLQTNPPDAAPDLTDVPCLPATK